MDVFEAFAEHNREFVKTFRYGELRMWPELTAVIVTCVDPRLEFHSILGADLGEIAILRSIGGRVTTAVLRDLSIYCALAEQTEGHEPEPMRIMLVHHTDCGAQRFRDPDTQALLAERTGLAPDDVEWLAIDEPSNSVARDMDLIRSHTGVPEGTTTAAYVYDVHTGQMTEVAAPSVINRLPRL